jgi:hypothetical protein
MGASLARIAPSGLHGDDAPACDFTAESAEKGAEGAEWMRIVAVLKLQTETLTRPRAGWTVAAAAITIRR